MLASRRAALHLRACCCHCCYFCCVPCGPHWQTCCTPLASVLLLLLLCPLRPTPTDTLHFLRPRAAASVATATAAAAVSPATHTHRHAALHLRARACSHCCDLPSNGCVTPHPTGARCICRCLPGGQCGSSGQAAPPTPATFPPVPSFLPFFPSPLLPSPPNPTPSTFPLVPSFPPSFPPLPLRPLSPCLTHPAPATSPPLLTRLLRRTCARSSAATPTPA